MRVYRHAGAALAAVVAALVGGGASLGASRATPPPISKQRAIRVAFEHLKNHDWFKPFPRRVGRVACQIPSGGINNPPIPGYCQTRVGIGRRYITVALIETWESDDFDGEGGRLDGPLARVWIVTESKQYKVLDNSTFGDFPPQLVR